MRIQAVSYVYPSCCNFPCCQLVWHQHSQLLAVPLLYHVSMRLFPTEEHVHTEVKAEPYVHAEVNALLNVHPEAAAVPYVHEDVPTEEYVLLKSRPWATFTLKVYSMFTLRLLLSPCVHCWRWATAVAAYNMIVLPLSLTYPVDPVAAKAIEVKAE